MLRIPLLMMGLLLCSQGFAATAQQNKMTTCNAEATTKTLKGDDRKAFMKTCYHKRTKSEIKKIRANFDKKGGAKEKYMKKMAKDPKSLQKYGPAGVDRMKKGQVPEGFDVHHKKPIFRGGNNRQSNLELMDKSYHKANSKALHWYPEGENPYGLN